MWSLGNSGTSADSEGEEVFMFCSCLLSIFVSVQTFFG